MSAAPEGTVAPGAQAGAATPVLPETTLASIRPHLERHFRDGPPSHGRSRVPLSAPTWGAPEVLEAIQAMLEGQVTMGPRCRLFEERFAKLSGSRTALFANSGSSSNLLAVAALANRWVEGHWKPGDEVITPAVTWSTTVWPLVQHGLQPVFVDVDPTTLTIDLDALEAAITPRTRGLALVHLLGHPIDMDRVLRLARERSLLVFEDCCEALGASWGGKPVGSFGDAGSFSTYFSHHITTIEGGLLVTDRDDVAEAGRALREHGWTRSLAGRAAWARKHPGIDDRFLFANTGYNLRPTELNAAFGLHQLGRLPGFLAARQANHDYWVGRLRRHPWLQTLQAPPGSSHFSFAAIPRPGAPFTRQQLAAFLESRGIETRPIMTGNFLRHPVWKDLPHRAHSSLPVADRVSDNGLLWGNHHLVGPAERAHVADAVDDFMGTHA